MPGDGGVSPSPCYRDVKVAQLQLGSAAAHMRHSTHPFPRVLRSPILCVLFFMRIEAERSCDDPPEPLLCRVICLACSGLRC